MTTTTDKDKELIPVRWLKPIEAALYARVTVSKIRQWIAEGVLPVSVTRNKQDFYGKGAGGYILDLRDIDKLMEQLKIRMGDSDVPRASGQTGRQRGMDRGGSKPAPPPVRYGPYVKPSRGKLPRPDEPA